jgi:hypothetical protein
MTKRGKPMKLELLKKLYQDNHLSEDSFWYAESVLRSLDEFAQDQSVFLGIDMLKTDILDQFIEQLVLENRNTKDAFVAMMRYFKVTKQHELFVRLTQYTGALDVLESIYSKMEKVIGKEKTESIKNAFPVPPLGTEIISLNRHTKRFVDHLKTQMNDHELQRILTDNHHLIPRSSFQKERLYYEASETLEDYLKDMHERHIQELQSFYEQDKVWYEQIITQDVIEFVKSNPEIMSAVLKDDALYITKIPYDTNQYIQAETKEMKAYHACHCPFAKASILEKGIRIDSRWCYCSAGFTKLPFEVALDQELPIECISSALKGDPLCRFKIDLSGIIYK